LGPVRFGKHFGSERCCHSLAWHIRFGLSEHLASGEAINRATQFFADNPADVAEAVRMSAAEFSAAVGVETILDMAEIETSSLKDVVWWCLEPEFRHRDVTLDLARPLTHSASRSGRSAQAECGS
jgi:hypothetical protein